MAVSSCKAAPTTRPFHADLAHPPVNPPSLSATTHPQQALAASLSRLRAFAVGGQLVTLLVVTRVLHLELPLSALIAAVTVHALFAAFVGWRLTKPWAVGEGEVVFHLAIDMGVLYWLLYLTGGATNPFISLYLL